MNEDKSYAERLEDYSTSDLQVILGDIDREKYPDRYDSVMKELNERKCSGDHARSSHVPTHVARAIWWAFFWRATLFQFIAAILLGIPLYLLRSTVPLSDATWAVVKFVATWAIYIPISIIVMSYVLAKSYPTFTISILEKETIQPKDWQVSSESAPSAPSEEPSS